MSSPRDIDRTFSEEGAAHAPPDHTLPDPDTPAPPQQAETVLFDPPKPPSSPGEDSSPNPAAATDVTLVGPDRVAPADPGESLSLDVPADLHKHGRYKITRLVGGGGMGMVYQAEHRMMDRTVALKVIHPRFLAQPAAVERFQREVQAAARLQHPNIVTAYDAEKAGSTHFLVTEFVHGQTVAEYLRRKGKLTIAEACDIARQAALGLDFAHRRKMAHRDIKPDNLMRSDHGEVKILDFGLARFVQEEQRALAKPSAETAHPLQTQVQESPTALTLATGANAPAPERDSQLTVAGSVMGTPDYMAPEQIRNTSSADIRSDIYALGCTLYQLMAGDVPFPGGKATEKLDRHLKEQPKPIRVLRPEMSVGLVQILDRMMAKNPAQRYQTPGEVAKALAPYARGEDPIRRRRLQLITALIALVFIGGAVAFFLYWNRTNYGTLQVKADEEVTVIVAAAGDKDRELERITIAGGTRELNLPAGGYHLALWNPPAGLALEQQEVTIERERTSHVRVVRTEVKKDKGSDWPVLPAPDPLELAKRASVLDSLPPIDLPPGSDLNLGRDIQLVAMLGGAEWRLSGPGCVPAFSADGKLFAIGSGMDILLMETATGKTRHIFRGHKQPMEALALSPDGKWLASSSRDGWVRLWDVAKGEEEQSWFKQHGALAFSKDSKTLAFTQGNSLYLLDLAAGRDSRRLQEVPLLGGATSLAIHPDGDWLAIGQGKGGVRLFSPKTKKTLFRSTKASWRVQVAFNASGDRLFVGSADELECYRTPAEGDESLQSHWSRSSPADGLLAVSGDVVFIAGHGGLRFTLTMVDAGTGKGVGPPVPLSDAPGNALAASSPDGQALALCSQIDGRVVQLYELKTGKSLNNLRGHHKLLTTLAFLPEGRLITTGSDRTLIAWDLAKASDIGSWRTFDIPISVAVSPDGSVAAVGLMDLDRMDQSVQFWTKDGFRKKDWLRLSGVPVSLSFGGDGKLLYVGGKDGRVLAFDMGSLKDRKAYATTTSEVEGLTLDRTGKALAAAGWEGQIHIWEVSTGRELHQLTGHATDSFMELTGIRALACSPDNRRLYSTGRDGTVRVWDWATGERTHLLHGLSGEGVSLSVSPDGGMLAAAGSDGQVLLWDVASAPPRRYTLRRPCSSHRESPIAALAFSPEGRYLAVGSPDGAAHIFRLAPVGKAPELKEARGGLTHEQSFSTVEGSAVVVPGGDKVVSVHKGKTLRLWDIKSGKDLLPPAEENFIITRVAVTPDGKHAWYLGLEAKPGGSFYQLRRWELSGKGERTDFGSFKNDVMSLNNLGQVMLRDKDGQCKILDAAGEEVMTIGAMPKALGALSPDGRWAVATLGLRSAFVVDLKAKKTVQKLAFDGVMPHFTFSPDGKRLAWISEREKISVFDLEANRLVQTLELPETTVREIAISGDHKHLVIGGMLGALTLYDIESGRRLDTVRTALLGRAAFLPDGRLLTTHLLSPSQKWRLPGDEK